MTNLKKIYEISAKITNKIDQLYYYVSSNIENEQEEYKNTIEELKELVILENKIVSSMTMEEIDKCFSELKELIKNNYEDVENENLETFEDIEICLTLLLDDYGHTNQPYDIDALLRCFDRLKNKCDILCGEGLYMKVNQTKNELVNNKDNKKYEVSVWDVLTSSLNIDVIKSLKTKIYALVPYQTEDSEFIEELKFNLKYLQIQTLFGNFASELKAIHANNDIDKIKNTDIEKIKKTNILDQGDIYEFILEEAKGKADELSGIEEQLSYTPDTVFEFLKTITSFEILVSKLDIESLKELYNYCKELSNQKNYPCMSGINNFVKTKIKNN